jgi:hypothetical protein
MIDTSAAMQLVAVWKVLFLVRFSFLSLCLFFKSGLVCVVWLQDVSDTVQLDILSVLIVLAQACMCFDP